jgi:hypothetical protein
MNIVNDQRHYKHLKGMRSSMYTTPIHYTIKHVINCKRPGYSLPVLYITLTQWSSPLICASVVQNSRFCLCWPTVWGEGESENDMHDAWAAHDIRERLATCARCGGWAGRPYAAGADPGIFVRGEPSIGKIIEIQNGETEFIRARMWRIPACASLPIHRIIC